MRIVIVGCGKIGISILQSLVAENHEIVAIDSNPNIIKKITDNFDIMGICASGTHYKTLSEAMVESCDLFLATTSSDELNMLSCFLAKKMGAKRTVARIRTNEYSKDNLDFIKRELELSMIVNPDLLTAQAIHSIIKFPSAVKFETFTRRSLEVAEIPVREGSIFDNVKISDLRSKVDASFLICAVLRGDKTYIPNGDFVIHADDRIGLLAVPEEIMHILRNADMLQKQTKNVMIIGASRIALYLCELLAQGKNQVKLIEKDADRCQEIAPTLPNNVSLIQGDSRPHLLSEEGLARSDAFVAVTGLDEENILSSSYAVGLNVPKVITKQSQDDYNKICDQLGLDCVISPKRITAAVVTRYARALQNSVGSKVETLYRLMNGTVEAVEFTVSREFGSLDIQLKDLKLKPNTLIAGIIRGNSTIIPGGMDVIKPMDRVIIITTDQIFYDLADILA